GIMCHKTDSQKENTFSAHRIIHLLEPGPSFFGAPGAQIGQHCLRVIVQDHADKLIQGVVGSDVDLWGASEKMTQTSSTFIVDVCIDQFNRNILSEEKVGQRT